MDTTTWIILGILLLAALYFFYTRNRTPPRGTYDDENYRSSGSIGRGSRAYDDKDVRSGGSIGGSQSTYDSPEHRSSGTIGGNQTAGRSARRVVSDEPEERTSQRPSYDSDEFESSGSIGGSARPRSEIDDDREQGRKPPRR